MTTVSKGNSIEIDVVKAALFEDYEILDELGRGGMAIVYRAKERALDREVAIKVLPAILAMDDEFVQRFTHEARTAGRLEHPNIVPIYRVGSSGHVTYFVMKLLSGQSLSRVVRERGKLSVGEVRRILIECGGALGYAAKRNIVHRDIKPDNILLDAEGRCVITDFGIAKAPGGAQTAAGTSLGTPRYMSPEHAQGIPLDGRSDMYSLGVVAYQSLVGKLPYDAEDPFAILYKHINEPLPRPELVSDEEWALFAVIERMLSKKAEDRFQSADDLIVALGGHVSEPTLVSKSLPSMLVAAQPTEIIPTPTFGLKMKRFWTQDWRSWAGASAIAMGAMLILMITSMRGDSVPPVDSAAARDTKAAAPVIGASTGTSTAAQRAADSAAATKSVASNTTPRPAARQTGTTTTKTAAATPATTNPTPPARRALPSKCAARPGEFHVLLDQVADQRPGRRLPVSFDVCGLTSGTRFSADVRFRKRGRFGGGSQFSRAFPDEASSTRERRIHLIDLSPLSAGDYYLDVIVTDQRGTQQGKTIQFKLLNR
jgi:serine/threonine protein kinase